MMVLYLHSQCIYTKTPIVNYWGDSDIMTSTIGRTLSNVVRTSGLTHLLYDYLAIKYD